tara:strand:+ start:372 stop:635 length:264 start_codon:yes stop_codon:yes gene_type:complete
MTSIVRFARPVITREVPPDIQQRIRHRARDLKVCVLTEYGESHIVLLFEDLASAYHIRSVAELDRIIDALLTIREDVKSGPGRLKSV